MTVSSELFLPTANTAATGSDRNSASIEKTSPENTITGFKDHLGQATDNQSSGMPVNATKPENAKTALINNQQVVSEVLQEITDDVSFNGSINSENNSATTDPSPKRTAEAAEVRETIAKEVVESLSTHNGDASPKEIIPGAIISDAHKNPQQGNGHEGMAKEKSQANTNIAGEINSPEGKIPTQALPDQNRSENISAEHKTARNKSAEYKSQPLTNERNSAAHQPITHEQDVSKVAQNNKTDILVTNNILPETNSGPQGIGPQSIYDNAEVIRNAPELVQSNITAIQAAVEEEINTEPKSPTSQNASVQINVDKAPSQTKVDPKNIVAQEAQVVAMSNAPDTIPQNNPQGADSMKQKLTIDTQERQSATPQQQIATTSIALPMQKEVEKNKVEKDSGKENIVVSARGKNNQDASDKAKGSSLNTGEDKNAASAAQSKPLATSPQQRPATNIPFLTELGQNFIGTEGKSTGLGILQPPSGVLVAQEITPNSLHTSGLSSLAQAKPGHPPVNPQMVTNQISVAIMKQTSEGQNSFRLSLKPADLGQVDIKMDFLADGKMVATVTVENERTLSLLQRDQGALEKALENAGFNAGGNSLNFGLKKQQNQGHSEFANNNSENGDSEDMPSLPNSIIGHQKMKMAYSDNALDINI